MALRAWPSGDRSSVTEVRSVSSVLPVYTAPRWLPGGHLQTIYAYSLRQTMNFRYRRERWETPDGDFIDLDWLDPSTPAPAFAGGSRSGFRPTGVVEGATGLPVGLHPSPESSPWSCSFTAWKARRAATTRFV